MSEKDITGKENGLLCLLTTVKYYTPLNILSYWEENSPTGFQMYAGMFIFIIQTTTNLR